MSIQVRATFAESLVAKIYQRQSETMYFGAMLKEETPCYFHINAYNVGTQCDITVLLINV